MLFVLKKHTIGFVGICIVGAAFGALMVAAPGCELILGIQDIEYADAGQNPGACWNAEGANGKGCYRAELPGCPLEAGTAEETHLRVINACTPSQCVAFTTELTHLSEDGGLPTVPNLPDGGAGGGSGGAGGGSGGAGGGSGGAGGSAPVIPDCTDIGGPKAIYITGSNAILPVIRSLAPELRKSNTYTLIYQAQSSCLGFDAIALDKRINGEANYYEYDAMDQQIVEYTCLLPKDQSVDIGTCDVYAGTCNMKDLSNAYIDYGDGPIQAMIFAVPKPSDQNVISRKAAYFVYGFGADSGVEPWTNASSIYSRDNKSGTKRMIAAAIDVPYDKWKGVELDGSGKMRTALVEAGKPGVPAEVTNATIGILDVINHIPVAADLKILAFEADGQSCGFGPDNDENVFDKRNVRDGHYVMWGPLHFYVRPAGGGGVPANPDATTVVNYLTGAEPLPNEGEFAVLSVGAQAKGRLIPKCAMRVTRSKEMGLLSPFYSKNPCGCFFEEVARPEGGPGGSPQGCTPCATQSECGTEQICSFGYCEAAPPSAP